MLLSGTRPDLVGDPNDFLLGEWCANSLLARLTSSAISALARIAARDASISRSAIVWKLPLPARCRQKTRANEPG